MEMKKYMTPEMEIVELKYNTTLLAGSDGDGGGGGVHGKARELEFEDEV